LKKSSKGKGGTGGDRGGVVVSGTLLIRLTGCAIKVMGSGEWVNRWKRVRL